MLNFFSYFVFFYCHLMSHQFALFKFSEASPWWTFQLTRDTSFWLESFWLHWNFLNHKALKTFLRAALIHREVWRGFLLDCLLLKLLLPRTKDVLSLYVLWVSLLLTSSFFSIISMRNSGSVIVLSSGQTTPCSFNKYSPRWSGIWSVLYALFMSELHSELSNCSFSLFPENLSGWIWLCRLLNLVVRSFESIWCCFSNPNRLK